jgi:hypothetical protein
MKKNNTIEDRCEHAARALDVFGITKEGQADYDNPEVMAVDLITDLLHLVRAHNFHNPLDILMTARMHFIAEEKLLPVKSWFVSTSYRSKAGNCLTINKTVKAIDGLTAADIVERSLSRKKNFHKVDSSNVKLLF